MPKPKLTLESWADACTFLLQILLVGLSKEATLRDFEASLAKLFHLTVVQECLKPLGQRNPGRTWAGLVHAFILEFPQACSGGSARDPLRMACLTIAACLRYPRLVMAEGELNSIVSQHIPATQAYGKHRYHWSSLAEVAADIQDVYWSAKFLKPGELDWAERIIKEWNASFPSEFVLPLENFLYKVKIAIGEKWRNPKPSAKLACPPDSAAQGQEQLMALQMYRIKDKDEAVCQTWRLVAVIGACFEGILAAARAEKPDVEKWAVDAWLKRVFHSSVEMMGTFPASRLCGLGHILLRACQGPLSPSSSAFKAIGGYFAAVLVCMHQMTPGELDMVLESPQDKDDRLVLPTIRGAIQANVQQVLEAVGAGSIQNTATLSSTYIGGAMKAVVLCIPHIMAGETSFLTALKKELVGEHAVRIVLDSAKQAAEDARQAKARQLAKELAAAEAAAEAAKARQQAEERAAAEAAEAKLNALAAERAAAEAAAELLQEEDEAAQAAQRTKQKAAAKKGRQKQRKQASEKLQVQAAAEQSAEGDGDAKPPAANEAASAASLPAPADERCRPDSDVTASSPASLGHAQPATEQPPTLQEQQDHHQPSSHEQAEVAPQEQHQAASQQQPSTLQEQQEHDQLATQQQAETAPEEPHQAASKQQAEAGPQEQQGQHQPSSQQQAEAALQEQQEPHQPGSQQQTDAASQEQQERHQPSSQQQAEAVAAVEPEQEAWEDAAWAAEFQLQKPAAKKSRQKQRKQGRTASQLGQESQAAHTSGNAAAQVAHRPDTSAPERPPLEPLPQPDPNHRRPEDAEAAAVPALSQRHMHSNGSKGPHSAAAPRGEFHIEDVDCMMCWEAGADMVFQPCGHRCMCSACCEPFVRNRLACPKCSQQILDGKRHQYTFARSLPPIQA